MALAEDVLIHTWHNDEKGNRAFGWTRVNVKDALRKREKQGRCIECNEPVVIHEESVNGAAHPEHRKRNIACSLSDVPSADRKVQK
jgi:formylmethanofuran dehydrogenase subunit E